MHLFKIEIADGKIVGAGDIVAKMGSTGRSAAAHLHFGVQICDERSGTYKYEDPLILLP
jgi:murein DD-endopeptidase MepM/ murein hydrolase activator NlpD